MSHGKYFAEASEILCYCNRQESCSIQRPVPMDHSSEVPYSVTPVPRTD